MHVKQEYSNSSSNNKETLAPIRFSAIVDNNFTETTTLFFQLNIFCIPNDTAILLKKKATKEEPHVLF